MTPLPLQFLLVLFAGWVSRHQQEMIEHLQEESRVLREQLGGKRVRFTNAQRRRLTRLAKPIGRRRLHEVSTVVNPDTLLRRYRKLVAQKYDGSAGRSPGRLRIEREIQHLIVQTAVDNPR